jgi:hypothetical protein
LDERLHAKNPDLHWQRRFFFQGTGGKYLADGICKPKGDRQATPDFAVRDVHDVVQNSFDRRLSAAAGSRFCPMVCVSVLKGCGVDTAKNQAIEFRITDREGFRSLLRMKTWPLAFDVTVFFPE